MSDKILKKINNTLVFFKNNKPAICPFKNAIPIQDKFGSLQVINNECADSCPFFNATETSLTLSCNGTIEQINITIDE